MWKLLIDYAYCISPHKNISSTQEEIVLFNIQISNFNLNESNKWEVPEKALRLSLCENILVNRQRLFLSL